MASNYIWLSNMCAEMINKINTQKRIWPEDVYAIVMRTQKLIEENIQLQQVNAASNMGRIIALASERLRKSRSDAEREVLSKLLEIAEGKDDRELNATTRANLRQAFVAGAQWAIDDMDEDVMITLGS